MTNPSQHPTCSPRLIALCSASILTFLAATIPSSCSSDDSKPAESGSALGAGLPAPATGEPVVREGLGPKEGPSPTGADAPSPPEVELRDLELQVLMPGGEPATFVSVRLLDTERIPTASLLRATGGQPDAEKLLEVLGEEKTTDGRGRVLFQASGGVLLASATLKRLFVMQPFSPQAVDSEVLTLQLAIDSSVRARAVDAEGAPIAGVPIALSMELPTPGADTPARWIDLAVRETSGDDATVRFRDPRGGVQSPGGEHTTRFGVRAAIPGLADPAPILFDPDAPPEQPLDVAVPRLSTFVVETLSPSGQRLDIEADVFVEAQPTRSGSRLRARLKGGRATFRTVVPGTLLRVTVQPLDGSAAFEGVGPGADVAGDVATISVSIGGVSTGGGR